MKKTICLIITSLLLLSCSKQTPEDKFETNLKNDINNINGDLYDTPIGSEEFENKSKNYENSVGESLEKNELQYQIDSLIEKKVDLTKPRDVIYSISIFDNSKDTKEVEKKLTDNGFKIGEKKDVYGMTMFDAIKTHIIDKKIIEENDKLLKSLITEKWLSYDGVIIE